MRKVLLVLGVISILGLTLFLVVPPETIAQWGAIGTGVDAARRAAQERERPAAPAPGPHNVASEAVGGKGLATTTTFKNRVRPFSYTIPAGWRQEGSGDPTGKNAQFMLPGTTAGFVFHFTQMVPSFPRKASVDASYKHAREEMTIGRYMMVKRRDQGGKHGVIGWETIETPDKCSGGIQRIQWQCYDSNNYYYSFIAHADPRQFPQHRAVLQRIIDSVTFDK
ncbi:MAG: hypothetical protein AB1491_10965 [Thermodesulfobacteriota bacterium]